MSNLTAAPNLKPTIVTYVKDGELHADTHWTGADLDRPCTGGIVLGADTRAHRMLAARLTLAVEAGAVYLHPEVATDIYGQSYVKADRKVMGKYLNADLVRLGF